MSLRLLPAIVLILVFGGCAGAQIPASEANRLVDPNATPETQALFLNLDRIRTDHVLFGHQDDLAYGVEWWNEPGRSDVRDVAGSYPAVYGWEIGDLEFDAETNLDNVAFDDMRRWIIEGYGRGGVITLGWHMNNPATGGNAWDTTRAIHAVVPGGEHHETYRRWLDTFANFVTSLQATPRENAASPHLVPVIFRPLHEMTGSWFWWGGDNVTPEEYRQLWRFTVDYLRDERGIHNLLYAFSTDVFDSEEDFLRYYPGDEYVDIMGFDDYHSLRQDEGGVEMLAQRLGHLVAMAESRDKIPAFTETGYETIPEANYWTEKLLAAMKADPAAQRIAYVLLWRNANAERDRPDHFYAPYDGHPSAENFTEFADDPLILLEDELPDMYELP